MSILTIESLSFSYDKEIILQSINLTVEERDFLAIIGPNGGGKSTLLKLILGLLKPQKGTISILGSPPQHNRSAIGYVPQNTNINTHFPIRVIEVVMMGFIGEKRPLFGYTPQQHHRAMAILKEVGMESFAHAKIGSLSGGQRQRIMIARALCANPKILLLDEPTSSIDVKGQREIYNLLKKLNQSITIIVVSHDISVILEYANKTAHINRHLAYHDISNKKETFHIHDPQEHFCEVELLQMLGSSHCTACDYEVGSTHCESCHHTKELPC